MEQIDDLTEDELTMLWFTINVVDPKILNYEIPPNLFTSINYDMLKDRVLQCEHFVKEEFKPIFNDMKRKLDMPYTEIKPALPEIPPVTPEEPVVAVDSEVKQDEPVLPPEENKNL